MGAATLHEISHSRMTFLGLGVGHQTRTQLYFGINQTQRLMRMREYVEIIKKLFSGEDTTYHGKFYNMKKFPRLSTEPLRIPIYLADSAPGVLELAGRMADGVILNSISNPEYVAFARERIAESARSVGRDPNEIEVCQSVIYAVADESLEALGPAKDEVLFYIAYPERSSLLRQVANSPFEKELLKMRELYFRGDKNGALSLITDDILDAFAVYGSPKECREGLEKFVRRGIDLPIVRVPVRIYKEQAQNVFLRSIDSLKDWQNE